MCKLFDALRWVVHTGSPVREYLERLSALDGGLSAGAALHQGGLLLADDPWSANDLAALAGPV